jgi:hypothetical protein
VTETSARARVRSTSVKPLIARAPQEGNQAYYQQKLASARPRSAVKTDDAAIDRAINAKKSAVEMFREAGEQPGADERIRAYRQGSRPVPDNEYAPQALFMVGFVESEENRLTMRPRRRSRS